MPGFLFVLLLPFALFVVMPRVLLTGFTVAYAIFIINALRYGDIGLGKFIIFFFFVLFLLRVLLLTASLPPGVD